MNQSVTAPAGRPSRVRTEIAAVGAALVVFSVSLVIQAWHIAEEGGLSANGPAIFPMAVSGGLLLFSAIFLIQSRVKPDAQLEHHLANERTDSHMGTVIKVMAVLLAYAGVVGILGYALATTAMFAVISRLLGSRRWPLNVGIAIGLSVAIYYSFTMLLGVRLPDGMLGGVI